MPTPVPDVEASDTAQGADGGDDPPSHTYDASLQPGTVPHAAEHGAKGAEGSRVGLTEAVNCGKNGWVRRGVVDEDDL